MLGENVDDHTSIAAAATPIPVNVAATPAAAVVVVDYGGFSGGDGGSGAAGGGDSGGVGDAGRPVVSARWSRQRILRRWGCG
jgi:hypothetical protein